MNRRDDSQSTQVNEDETLAASDVSCEFFGTAEEVMARYTHCSLCGAHLHFSYFTDFGQNLTQETAKCPECGVRARQILHKLQ